MLSLCIQLIKIFFSNGLKNNEIAEYTAINPKVLCGISNQPWNQLTLLYLEFPLGLFAFSSSFYGSSVRASGPLPFPPKIRPETVRKSSDVFDRSPKPT